MNKNEYEVNVLVNGKPIREYQHDNRVFIQGNKGTHYEIRVKNNSWMRIKAVIFVDGNSILSDDNSSNIGYIINGRDSLIVKGFRTSDDTEAEFIFSSKGESRAQKVKGYAKNCGVIGVKIIPEKICQSISWVNSWNNGLTLTDNDEVRNVYFGSNTNNLQNNNPIQCNCSAGQHLTANSFDLGTEMGMNIESKVKRVQFKEGYIAEEFVIYYASRKGLQDMGVDLHPKKEVHIPQPFGGYCKRPKNSKY